MITALASDQHAPGALAAQAMVSQRDLQRGVDGFGAGVGKEHVVELLRRDRHHFFRGLECGGMMQLEAGGVIDGLGLLLDRVDDRPPAVAGIDRPQSGNAVEHLAAIVGLVMHVLGGHQ